MARNPNGAPEPAPPLELARERPEPREVPEPTTQVFRRKAPRPRRPPSTGHTLVVWGLAAVGLIVVGRFAWQKVRGLQLAESAPAAQAPAAAVAPMRPLAADDAVLVEVDVVPRDARILLDGTDLPSNPVRLPRGTGVRLLGAVASGYEPAERAITPDRPQRVKLRLARAR